MILDRFFHFILIRTVKETELYMPRFRCSVKLKEKNLISEVLLLCQRPAHPHPLQHNSKLSCMWWSSKEGCHSKIPRKQKVGLSRFQASGDWMIIITFTIHHFRLLTPQSTGGCIRSTSCLFISTVSTVTPSVNSSPHLRLTFQQPFIHNFNGKTMNMCILSLNKTPTHRRHTLIFETLSVRLQKQVFIYYSWRPAFTRVCGHLGFFCQTQCQRK